MRMQHVLKPFSDRMPERCLHPPSTFIVYVFVQRKNRSVGSRIRSYLGAVLCDDPSARPIGRYREEHNLNRGETFIDCLVLWVMNNTHCKLWMYIGLHYMLFQNVPWRHSLPAVCMENTVPCLKKGCPAFTGLKWALWWEATASPAEERLACGGRAEPRRAILPPLWHPNYSSEPWDERRTRAPDSEGPERGWLFDRGLWWKPGKKMSGQNTSCQC